MFQNITQIMRNKLFFNHLKQRKMELSCSKKRNSVLLRGLTSKHDGDF